MKRQPWLNIPKKEMYRFSVVILRILFVSWCQGQVTKTNALTR